MLWDLDGWLTMSRSSLVGKHEERVPSILYSFFQSSYILVYLLVHVLKRGIKASFTKTFCVLFVIFCFVGVSRINRGSFCSLQATTHSKPSSLLFCFLPFFIFFLREILCWFFVSSYTLHLYNAWLCSRRSSVFALSAHTPLMELWCCIVFIFMVCGYEFFGIKLCHD